VLFW